MILAELGKPDRSYFPPSLPNVNCENPHGKPVSHLISPSWSLASGFSHRPSEFSSALHKASPYFTGCTQRVIRSGLRELLLPVQSRRRKSIELKGPGD